MLLKDFMIRYYDDLIMFEVLNLVYPGVITILSALMVYYLASKKVEKTINFYKKQLKDEAEKWLNSETGTKALYSVGVMVGNGAKDSIGLGSKGGKFKWQDLLAQIGVEWARKSLPVLNLAPGDTQKNLNSESQDRIKQFGSA